MKKSSKWCIFNINNKHCLTIAKELKEKGYDKLGVKVSLPTVSILRKRQKGKDIYEDVPLLFNYGFVKMPTEMAYSRPLLRKLTRDITGICSWVKSNDTMHEKKLRRRIDGEDFDDFSKVAIASNNEVRRFKRMSRENKVYQADEIINLSIDSYVVLRGYPFNGVNATIKEVNLVTKEITVMLYPGNTNMIVKLPMDNVVYSIYQNYDENKLFCNSTELDTTNIQSEDIEDKLTKRQF